MRGDLLHPLFSFLIFSIPSSLLSAEERGRQEVWMCRVEVDVLDGYR